MASLQLPAIFKQNLCNINYSSKGTVHCYIWSKKNVTGHTMATFKVTEISLKRICKLPNVRKFLSSSRQNLEMIFAYPDKTYDIRYRVKENKYQAQIQN